MVSSTIESVGFFARPAVAGFLLAYANITTAFVFDAATFIWSVLFVATVTPLAATDQSPEMNALLSSNTTLEGAAEPFFTRSMRGSRAIRGDRNVRSRVESAIALSQRDYFTS